MEFIGKKEIPTKCRNLYSETYLTKRNILCCKFGLHLLSSSPALNAETLFQFCCDLPTITQEGNLLLNQDLNLGFL